MLQKMKNYITQYHMLDSGDCVLCGCSGGADSVALLLLLDELREALGITLEAVCVEHGIRGEESRSDARFVEELCRKKQISCRVYPVDAVGYAKAQGLGLEESARMLRYEAFRSRAAELGKEKNREVEPEKEESRKVEPGKAGCGAVKLALAHHMEDNAETMLFQLSRGSGLSGLCGIAPVRAEGEILVIRPLLWADRSQIEAYLKEKGQSYCTDSTNADPSYSRNRIRQRILPELETVNTKAVFHMSRTAEQLREIRDYMEQEIETKERELATFRDGVWSIGTAALLSLPAALRKGVIRNGICKAAGSKKDIAAVHVDDVAALLWKQSGRRIALPYGVEASVSFGTLRIEKLDRVAGTSKAGAPCDGTGSDNGTPSEAGKPGDGTATANRIPPVLAEVTGTQLENLKGSGAVHRVELPTDGGTLSFFVREWNAKSEKIEKKAYTKFFDYDMIKDGFLARKRASGDYFIMDDQGHRKKLSDYLIDEKIPVEKRDEMILLAQDSKLVWIVGGRIGADYKVTDETKYVLVVEYNGGNENG
jgi:tRNA(Ile)-lysidine synthase